MELSAYKKKILIACSMIEDEINAAFDRFEIRDIEIRWQERGHHNDPDKLREVIQAEINRAEKDGADLIMLGYGLCGNGAVGWHTEKAVLAMPRFDDCVNMMLCTDKRDRRNYLKAGHMYLSKIRKKKSRQTHEDDARFVYECHSNRYGMLRNGAGNSICRRMR